MKKGTLKCTTLPFPTVQHTGKWVEKELARNSLLIQNALWTDGADIYLTSTPTWVLKENKWELKTWNVNDLYFGPDVWTDGENIYYSQGSTQYVLVDGAWEPKEWNVALNGRNVWSDGVNIYYMEIDTPDGINHSYVIDNGTWKPKTWYGIDDVDYFQGEYIWSDGVHIYYSFGGVNYVLKGDSWEKKTWNIKYVYGDELWTDGVCVYCNNDESCCVLQGDEFVDKEWNIPITNGLYVWTDGVDIYYSHDDAQYVLERTPTVPASATYCWQVRDGALVSVGVNDNPITVLEGGIVDGVFQNARYQLATPFNLAHDKDWALEWRMSGQVQNEAAMVKLWADTAKQGAINSICYIGSSKANAITIANNGSTHIHYGVDLVENGIDYNGEHLYRLENRLNADGTNMVWLCVDGTDIAPMTDSFSASEDFGESDWLSGKDFSFGYMGVPRYILNGFIMDDIAVWESGASTPPTIPKLNHAALMQGFSTMLPLRRNRT